VGIIVSRRNAWATTKGVFGLTFSFGFAPKSQRSNQMAESERQLFLKADFLVV
jgi:hypothetical protein